MQPDDATVQMMQTDIEKSNPVNVLFDHFDSYEVLDRLDSKNNGDHQKGSIFENSTTQSIRVYGGKYLKTYRKYLF